VASHRLLAVFLVGALFTVGCQKSTPTNDAKEPPNGSVQQQPQKPPRLKEKAADERPEPVIEEAPAPKPVVKGPQELILGKWVTAGTKEEMYYQFMQDGTFTHTFFSKQLDGNLAVKGRYTLKDPDALEMRYEDGLPCAQGKCLVTPDQLEVKGLLSSLKCRRVKEK
jgi:hypothetical protein